MSARLPASMVPNSAIPRAAIAPFFVPATIACDGRHPQLHEPFDAMIVPMP